MADFTPSSESDTPDATADIAMDSTERQEHLSDADSDVVTSRKTNGAAKNDLISDDEPENGDNAADAGLFGSEDEDEDMG
jgi:hypothetical protein